MIAVALDTNAYSEAKRGKAEAVEIVRSADVLALPVVVIGELLAGFGMGRRERRNRAELSAFLRSPRVRVLDFTVATADRYAAVLRQLREVGKPIPTNDLWIAASVLEHGMSLFTRDGHFDDIIGLRVVRSSADLI